MFSDRGHRRSFIFDRRHAFRRSCAAKNYCAPAWKLIRGAALALAVSQLFFRDHQFAGAHLFHGYSPASGVRREFCLGWSVVAILASLELVVWPGRLLEEKCSSPGYAARGAVSWLRIGNDQPLRLAQSTAALMLVSMTALHYLATATWIGGAAVPIAVGEALRSILKLSSQIIAQFFAPGAGQCSRADSSRDLP